MKPAYFVLGATLAFGAAMPATAAVVQIVTPIASYTSATNLLGVPNPRGPFVAAIGDLNLTVLFSTPLDTREVGVDWSTWGSPPDTEDAGPLIFYTRGATSVEFKFSQKLNVWGFEAEPNPFTTHSYTVDYYDGATWLGQIVRSIDGNAGARLLAATHSGGFTRAIVTTDTDFAMAQLRYQIAVVPEPATWAMLIAGFGMVGFAARRRRMATVLSN